jgi:uncharacterized cupredoxin-like copper-binding protein
MSRLPQIRSFAIPLVGCALVLGACGGGSGDSTASAGGGGGGGGYGYGGGSSGTQSSGAAAASGATTLALKASESGGLSFSPHALHANAGSVTLKLDNPSGNGLAHAIALEGGGLDRHGATAQPGAASSVTVKLKPGTYVFYCPIGGHRAAGMQGRLTVR